MINVSKFLVTVVRNCNTSNDVEKTEFKDYPKAAKRFWQECKMLVQDYMDPGDAMVDWMCQGGIIEKEYGGIIRNDYLEFDGNVVQLEEIKEDGKYEN